MNAASVLGKVLLNRLKAFPAVTAQIGGTTPPNPRIAPKRSRQAVVLPRITYERISGLSLRSLSGSAQMGPHRVQVEAQALTDAAAHALADEILKPVQEGGPLDGFRGWVAGVFVQCIELAGTRDFYDEPTPEAGDVGVHRLVMDWIFWLG